MGLSETQYKSILRHYEELQTANRHLHEERVRFVNQHIEGYEKLEQQTITLAMKHARATLEENQDSLGLMHSQLHELMCEKKQLLLAHGLPDDYLAPIYSCQDCQDTGYDSEGKRCHCFRQQMIRILYEQSHIEETLQTDNFSSLSYDYYQGEDLVHFQNAVTTCQNFVKNFNSDYHNLFFYGTVGTGKSFLSGCVAKALLDKGNSILYFSSVGLFEMISRYAFGTKDKLAQEEAFKDLYNCDLLIIDDLGTELTNNFVTTQLFSCLNERHLRKKATVISTNLSLADIRDRYSDRIFSRITSNYEIIRISGPDIRILKKRLLNRK